MEKEMNFELIPWVSDQDSEGWVELQQAILELRLGEGKQGEVCQQDIQGSLLLECKKIEKQEGEQTQE